MLHHPCPIWGGSGTGDSLRSLRLGRRLVLGVRAQHPEVEDSHTWACALTEGIKTNLSLTKKVSSSKVRT